MPDSADGGRAAALAELGQPRKIHRVTRHLHYLVQSLILMLIIVAVSAILASRLWWLLFAAPLLPFGWFALIYYVPPSKGIRAIVRCDGGLIILAAGTSALPVPWAMIESCEYRPASSEHITSGYRRIYFAQLRLRLHGLRDQIVLLHLWDPSGLNAAVHAAIEGPAAERWARHLAEKFGQNGRVAVGGGVVVTPEGLLLSRSRRYRTSPLPWGGINGLSAPSRTTLAIKAWTDLNVDDGTVSFTVDDAPTVVRFITDVRRAAATAEPTDGAPAAQD